VIIGGGFEDLNDRLGLSCGTLSLQANRCAGASSGWLRELLHPAADGTLV